MNTQAIIFAISVVGAAAFAIYTSYREYQNSRAYEYRAPRSHYPPEHKPTKAKTATARKKKRIYQTRGDDDCRICLTLLEMGTTFTMDCNHMFHARCIMDWLKEKNECPICRAKVDL